MENSMELPQKTKYSSFHCGTVGQGPSAISVAARVSAEGRVWYPAWRNGLKIQCCCSYCVFWSCSLDMIPGPGTSIYCGCSQKTKNKNKNLNMELSYDSAIPLLSIYLEKTIIWKDKSTQIFTEVIFTIAKTWKHPKCPATEEWIRKMWYI